MCIIPFWTLWFRTLGTCPSLTGTAYLDLVYFLLSWTIKGPLRLRKCYVFNLKLLWSSCPSLVFLHSFISYFFSSFATFLSSVHFLSFFALLFLMVFLKVIHCKLGYVHIISVLCTLLLSVVLCLSFGHM